VRPGEFLAYGLVSSHGWELTVRSSTVFEMSAAVGIGTAGPLSVVIVAGTPITCELGHVICVAATDCHANEPLAVEMFTRWQRSAPKAGQKFPGCHVCEGAAYREGPDGSNYIRRKAGSP
jgi:hypothetical protein